VPGIIVTVILFTLIGSFAGYQFYQLIFFQNPTVSQISLMRDLDVESEYLPYINSFNESGNSFDFAIGTQIPIDTRAVSIEINEVT
jgi:hypothetical protein